MNETVIAIELNNYVVTIEMIQQCVRSPKLKIINLENYDIPDNFAEDPSMKLLLLQVKRMNFVNNILGSIMMNIIHQYNPNNCQTSHTTQLSPTHNITSFLIGLFAFYFLYQTLKAIYKGLSFNDNQYTFFKEPHKDKKLKSPDGHQAMLCQIL